MLQHYIHIVGVEDHLSLRQDSTGVCIIGVPADESVRKSVNVGLKLCHKSIHFMFPPDSIVEAV